jgi:hypothetical protein
MMGEESLPWEEVMVNRAVRRHVVRFMPPEHVDNERTYAVTESVQLQQTYSLSVMESSNARCTEPESLGARDDLGETTSLALIDNLVVM